jgi:hypothetical protein
MGEWVEFVILMTYEVLANMRKDRLTANDDDKLVRHWFIEETKKYGCFHKVCINGKFLRYPGLISRRLTKWATFLLSDQERTMSCLP